MIRHNTDETTHRSASDFTDEQGNFDESAIRSVTNRTDTTQSDLTPELCAEFRRKAVGEPNVSAIADEYERATSTITTHVAGRCDCEHDMPPLEYRHEYREGEAGSSGKWVYPDEYASPADGTDPRILQPEGEEVLIRRRRIRGPDRAYHSGGL